MLSYRHVLFALTAGALLNACATPAITPAPVNNSGVQTPVVTAQRPVLASALVKRPLKLGRVDGQVVPLAQVLTPETGFSVQMAMAEPAMDRMSIAPGYYYGGHDFNSYSIQYAEENIYPAASASTLVAVYNQNVKPMLAEWDADARLLESRAQMNAEHEEYIQLPGQDEPLRVKPRFVYRLASNAKKETLNVYVLDKEIRVHRMVWGEQNIEISRVKIDSDEAVRIARAAFLSKSNPSGIPVYPESDNAEATIVYDLPADAQWSLNLNQQSQDSLRYFVNFNFKVQVDAPEPKPGEPEPVDDANATKPSEPRPDIVYPTEQYLYGSLELDAITGQIKSMNRPVMYRMMYGGVAYPAEVAVDPVPADAPAAEADQDNA